MNNDIEKLEGKLIESMKIDGLGKLAQDYAELGLDLVTKDGILKDIPIVGTLVNAAKVVGSVRDRLYLRKLVLFLEKVGETTQEQREKFIDDNCQDTRAFEEAILLILEQADRIEKSILIGKIFKACILGKIKYNGALILSTMVNRVCWDDLVAMFAGEEDMHQQQRLFLSGLYETNEDIGWDEIGKLKVKRNKYANALEKINLEYYDQVIMVKK